MYWQRQTCGQLLFSFAIFVLTHWGRVTHICVSKITIIGSDNGLSPGRRQAIIWTNAGILLIGPRGTNFSEILIGIQTFSFNKMHLKMSSAKWRPFCLGLNVLKMGARTCMGFPGSWHFQNMVGSKDYMLFWLKKLLKCIKRGAIFRDAFCENALSVRSLTYCNRNIFSYNFLYIFD